MSTVLATQVRKHTSKPTRAAGRYWKGKAPKGAAEFPSDSDEDEEQPELQEEGDVLIGGEQDIVEDEEDEETTLPVKTGQDRVVKTMNLTLKDVNISKEGKVIVAGREESGRTKLEEDVVSEEESEEAPDEEEDEEDESESSESEEEPSKPLFRPVFVPKRGRETIVERDAIALEAEEVEKRKQETAEERRKQSHDLVAESIRRELLEKEKEEVTPDVDDTDGVDPGGEFEAWRLRELGRIKKEKEEELRREEEREEIERRRALPEEQRLKEDLERANKLREEKPKGQQKFLQKYWHKGAFHQDEAILTRHDYTEATESTVDVSMLPEVMRVKNFGKRSRTKYTHLLDQDTTQKSGGFGGAGSVKTGGRSTEGGGCFLCGGPHLKKGEDIMLKRLLIKLRFIWQTVLKIINYLQEPAVPWLLGLTRPLAHHAHGASNLGETGPTIKLIVVAQRRENQEGGTTPVKIDHRRRIAITAILELGVEDHGQGHLIAVV
ncbi:splicing factor, Prp19-binding domain-containing protein [Suillus lakei]|nr:splicing factor, Prp19-binding domain-containing protein [Suillus lakei]